MKTARNKADKELVALQRAITPDEVWRACDGLLRAMSPVTYTLLGLPSLGIVPFYLRTTMPGAQEYFAEFSKVAPLNEVIQQRPGTPVSRMSDHFTPTPEFHARYLAPANWAYAMAMLFWDTDGSYIGQLSAIRAEALGDFSDAEKKLWEEIHPHVGGAIRRLFDLERNAATRHSLERSLRSLPLPVVSVGWDMAVLYTNRSGREALHFWHHGTDARKLTPSAAISQDLHDGCRALREEWEEALRDHDLSRVERGRRLDHPVLPGLAVTIEVVEPASGRMLQPSFSLQFHLPVEQQSASGSLAALNKLTPAEQEIARLAANGGDNAEIANRLGVSESTVRTHLRHIFRKLEINRRSKLAPLILAPPN